MALINCYECDRENVSDSAETCPECGFNIAAETKRLNDEKEKAEEEKRIIDEEGNIAIKKKECPRCGSSVYFQKKPINSNTINFVTCKDDNFKFCTWEYSWIFP